MHFGWSSPADEFFQGNASTIPKYGPTYSNVSQVLFLIAGVVFTPLITYLVDKIGRKWTNIISSVLNLIAWVMIGVTRTAEVICVAYAFAGICYTFDMITIPMYVSEISDKKIRGFLLGYVLAMAMLGITTIYVIFPHVPVYFSSAVGGGVHLIHLGVLVFFPRTPYFWLLKGKTEKGAKALKFFHGQSEVDAMMAEIQEEIEIQKQLKAKIMDIFKDISSRKALLIGCVLYLIVPMHCMSALTMNMHKIIGDDGLLPKNALPVIFSSSLLLSQICCMFIVDKYGRKPLLLVSLIICEIALLSFSTFFVLKRFYPDAMTQPSVLWIPETVMIGYGLAYRFGIGPIPTALCAELFPLNHKALGMTFTFVVMTVADAIVVAIYGQFALAVDDMSLPFFLFIGIGVWAVPFVIFIVPETKNKSLEEIQQGLRKEKKLRVDKNSQLNK